ncbi:hypothetical protein MHB50_15300 [Siminovitchia sp. FSL H7-0308]|uniref:hypothetical protein n=1 Tax=Siminovitchia sp. FSL H7-0308 TaxID=2921432 RepID=UPI0030EE2F62
MRNKVDRTITSQHVLLPQQTMKAVLRKYPILQRNVTDREEWLKIHSSIAIFYRNGNQSLS